ncbi:hypothetical protein DH2020_025883 [Rehmannia glutinosa]|uniref:K Homology domain-containing protein n=1 Tax=Rehmannia glutinosa TaxID=99300 RepID=A0ABR0VYF8_REHGL
MSADLMAELDQNYELEQAHEHEYQPELVHEHEHELEQVHEHDEQNEPEDGIPENSHPDDEKQDHADEPVGGGGEKWPGWPGESIFRMLVPAQKVGSIIGRKGEYIKKTCEETRARIKILDGPPGTRERAVMVSAKEEPDALLPPAVDGLLRVHKRVLDGLENDSSHPPSGLGGKGSTRLLVPAAQAGSLIGKQGATVKSFQEESNCIVRVLGSVSSVLTASLILLYQCWASVIAIDLPIIALEDHSFTNVEGRAASFALQDDRVVEMQMPNSQMDHMPPTQQHWGPPPQSFPPHAHSGPGYGASPHFMPPPSRQFDSYYPPPADMAPPPEKQPHQGISAYGREAPMPVHSSSSQAAPSVITQVTQQMQIPLSYADAVIGTQVPGEMTVEISGTASQVQTAQQLIQNFMAEAAASQSQTQHAPSTDQMYNSYGGHGSVYTSPPSNPNHAAQTGGYGSVYGTNYGY